MNITIDQIVTGASIALAVAVPILAWADKLPFVQKNKGLASVMDHITAAAGQLAIEIPPGTSAAQVETMAIAKAGPIAAKFTGMSQAEVTGLIVGGVGAILPTGHIVSTAAASVSETAELISNVKTLLAAMPLQVAGYTLPSAIHIPTPPPSAGAPA